jgi:hypothetical protein
LAKTCSSLCDRLSTISLIFAWPSPPSSYACGLALMYLGIATRQAGPRADTHTSQMGPQNPKDIAASLARAALRPPPVCRRSGSCDRSCTSYHGHKKRRPTASSRAPRAKQLAARSEIQTHSSHFCLSELEEARARARIARTTPLGIGGFMSRFCMSCDRTPLPGAMKRSMVTDTSGRPLARRFLPKFKQFFCEKLGGWRPCLAAAVSHQGAVSASQVIRRSVGSRSFRKRHRPKTNTADLFV